MMAEPISAKNIASTMQDMARRLSMTSSGTPAASAQ